MTCVKPFTIPDKWIEKQTPPWDGTTPSMRSTTRESAGEPGHLYSGRLRPGYTGYNQDRNAARC